MKIETVGWTALGGVIILVVASWINNINFIFDSWDKEGLQMREIVAIAGVPIGPVGVVNGFVYFFEDEVNYN